MRSRHDSIVWGGAPRPLRRIHLIDIENLAGGAGVGPDEFRRVWHVYRHHAAGARPGDHIVVAASRFAARDAALALVGEPIQWRWRDGKDGAEIALIEHIDLAHAARRFGTIVVASGDHAFAPLMREARHLGMATQLVVGRGTCSRELWQACSTHTRMRLGERKPLSLAA